MGRNKDTLYCTDILLRKKYIFSSDHTQHKTVELPIQHLLLAGTY